jgi:hypothetical protein
VRECAATPPCVQSKSNGPIYEKNGIRDHVRVGVDAGVEVQNDRDEKGQGSECRDCEELKQQISW